MIFATEHDVRAALHGLGRVDLATALPDVDGLLAEASDLVAGYLHPTVVPSPAPGPVVRAVAGMVAAVLTRPSEILPDTESLSADGFGVTFTPGATSAGPYLTAAIRHRLRPFRDGAVSLSLVSERER